MQVAARRVDEAGARPEADGSDLWIGGDTFTKPIDSSENLGVGSRRPLPYR